MVKYFCDCCGREIKIDFNTHYCFRSNIRVDPKAFLDKDLGEKMLCEKCFKETFKEI